MSIDGLAFLLLLLTLLITIIMRACIHWKLHHSQAYVAKRKKQMLSELNARLFTTFRQFDSYSDGVVNKGQLLQVCLSDTHLTHI